jgi:hypothetical protein
MQESCQVRKEQIKKKVCVMGYADAKNRKKKKIECRRLGVV